MKPHYGIWISLVCYERTGEVVPDTSLLLPLSLSLSLNPFCKNAWRCVSDPLVLTGPACRTAVLSLLQSAYTWDWVRVQKMPKSRGGPAFHWKRLLISERAELTRGLYFSQHLTRTIFKKNSILGIKMQKINKTKK